MAKSKLKPVLVIYALVLGAVVWRASIKYGFQEAAWLAVVGLTFLIVLLRAWRGFRFVVFGGRRLNPADQGGANFLAGSSTLEPPRP